MYQLCSITLIFKSVVKKGVAHSNLSGLRPLLYEVFQLLVPHPVVGILAGQNGLIFSELVNHINIVNYIEDKGLYLGKKKSIPFIVERSVTFKLFLQVLLVICKFSFLHGL